MKCKVCQSEKITVSNTFCSYQCFGKQGSINRYGSKTSKYPFLKQCIECNIDFLVNNTNQRNNKFCSLSCSATHNNKKRINDDDILKNYKIYKEQAKFTFYIPDCQDKIPGIDLLIKFGMYHPIKNKNGVSRDHKLSISDGFKSQIDPKILSHPANCEFLLQTDNSKKNKNSSITYSELVRRIDIWNKSFRN